ncbi:putative inner membrane complex protein IMC3 [Neospora caninum Liverpool]|uniref:Inner membrane complex protein IMC3, putative n=1 Tax=Neospora caninum (strain Liverpool) TaxID=572307 RepID=F0VPE3_NEOCL|nr:putative inner membrane complex protein IMC3 [Neospora caninum Liverpool]CBZ55589.1 putative inner membrane complex protein IMC3 [Neospora caninum Liverpool]CEL70331.1 TPA: inner membrane complex protein IMC3, putative [Neospora caninum Liverpool]|eukprot:XP_003885617.1 putative inner membrane complex protein IMC3 [Neospora caninum Liverpool]
MSDAGTAPALQGELSQPQERVEVVIQPIPGTAETPEADVPQASVVEGAFHGEVPYPYPPFSTGLPVPEQPADSQAAQVSEAEAAEEAADAPIARPPPQVMTALGPMPLPAEVRQKIPEKFVAKPIVEEREIYVSKKEVRERTIEVPHVHYEHKFAEIARSLKIKKLVPRVKEVVKEVPREVYKPVIEEKVIEVPQGVKYVEVPVEVPCLYPPKIVPKPKVQVIERIVETIKPVVKEKIVEVPQTVVKQIPKIKTVEVPYYVPRYVEKIIEIPYQPPDSATLPPLMVGGLPSRVSATMPTPFQMGPVPAGQLNEINLPYEARVDINVSQEHPTPGSPAASPQTGTAASVALGRPATTLVNPDRSAPAIELPDGFTWGPPPNVPPESIPGAAMPGLPGLPGGPLPGGSADGLNMPPMMITCPPEVGNVKFAGYLAEPDILTRRGVMAYQGFKKQGTFQMLFPPLAPQPGIPLDQSGSPDVRTLVSANEAMASQSRHQLIENLQQQVESEYDQKVNASVLSCTPWAHPAQEREIVYEQ